MTHIKHPQWPTREADRVALFRELKAALARAGLTLGRWTTEHDVSRQHLSQCVHGKRTPSPTLVDAILATITTMEV